MNAKYHKPIEVTSHLFQLGTPAFPAYLSMGEEGMIIEGGTGPTFLIMVNQILRDRYKENKVYCFDPYPSRSHWGRAAFPACLASYKTPGKPHRRQNPWQNRIVQTISTHRSWHCAVDEGEGRDRCIASIY